MKMMKDMMFMAAGMGAMYMYQKYKKPLTKAIKNAMNEEVDMINDLKKNID